MYLLHDKPFSEGDWVTATIKNKEVIGYVMNVNYGDCEILTISVDGDYDRERFFGKYYIKKKEKLDFYRMKKMELEVFRDTLIDFILDQHDSEWFFEITGKKVAQ